MNWKARLAPALACLCAAWVTPAIAAEATVLTNKEQEKLTVDLLSEADAPVIEAARKVNMWYIRYSAVLINQIGDRSETAENRILAINEAAALRNPEAIAALLPLLTLEDPEELSVYSAASQVLASLGDRRAIELWKAVKQDSDQERYLIAYNALHSMSTFDVATCLIGSQSEKSAIRNDAQLNLLELDAEQGAEHLIATLQTDRERLNRRFAASALAKAPGERTTEALIYALNDPDTRTRRLAALSLGQLGAREALPYLFFHMELGNASPDYLLVIQAMTGEDFGYNLQDTPLDRRQATNRAYAWWAQQQTEF